MAAESPQPFGSLWAGQGRGPGADSPARRDTPQPKGRYIYGASKKGRTRDDIAITTTGVTSGAFVSVQACGTCAAATVVAPAAPSVSSFSRTLGNKQYEFSNHLGNVLVTVSDRRIAVDDGTYTYASATLTKVNSTPDRKLDYYLPHVLTVTDYYPGGAPMPGRTLGTTTCSTTTTATVTTVRNDHFSFTTHSYGSIGSAGVNNVFGQALEVAKLNATVGIWGTRVPLTAFTQGVSYTLSFSSTYSACTGNSGLFWRLVTSGGTVVTSGPVATGAAVVTFTVPSSGNYYIDFYRTSSTAGACNFVLDNVVLSYVSSYTQSTSCGTSTADGYPWGHNGQLKDNEIYGKGNAYSAEYWEYDARLIRRWNTDPITYDWQSPYACFNNNPIYFVDPLGLEGEDPEPLRKPRRGNRSRAKFETKTDHPDKYGRFKIKTPKEQPLIYIEKPREHYGNSAWDRLWRTLTAKHYINQALDFIEGLESKGINHTVRGNERKIIVTKWKQVEGSDISGSHWVKETEHHFNNNPFNTIGEDYWYPEETDEYVEENILDWVSVPNRPPNPRKVVQGGRKILKISKLAQDWIRKGAHVHWGKIELSLKPGKNGVIIIKSVFSSQNAKQVEKGIKMVAEQLNNNPQFKKELIDKVRKGIEMFKNGTAEERAFSGELKFLLNALMK